jgi:HD superfamily phosphohydrolase
MEKIDWDLTQKYITKKGWNRGEILPLPKKYPKHDRLGEIVITERKDIKEKLQKNKIDPLDIAALVRGQHHTIPNLLNASLDVDRLDYLVRDSLNTGVPYGKVDLNYIVNNLELTGKKEKEMVLHAKARSSIEHMLMGRYFMFNTIYLHKTVFAFEEMTRRIILMLWKKGEIHNSGEEIENMARADSDEFLAFDDGYLDKLIDKYAKDKKNKKLSALCKAVKLRKPPKLVYEISEFVWDNNHPSPEYVILSSSWDTKVNEFAKDKEIGIPEEFWFFRDIKGAEFEKVHPFMSLAEVRELKESKELELRELVKVKGKTGKITNLVEDESSILHYMSRLKPILCRVYVLGIDDTKARQIRDKIEEWLKPEASR